MSWRRFQRYFTFAHLHNSGLSDEELQTYRNALNKLVKKHNEEAAAAAEPVEV